MAKWLKCYSVLLLAFFLINACAQNQAIGNRDKTLKEEMTSSLYAIGKGDILEITTWKEPDFSKEVQVRIDGKISFPLIGDIQAAGRSTEEVQKTIQKELSTYLTSPHTTVALKVPVSQKIYIIGEVAKPGEYPLMKELSALQLIALAGGFTEWASKEIIVLRNENQKEKRIRINYKSIVKDDSIHKDIDLQADDVIVIP